jgi:hypothetical protein
MYQHDHLSTQLVRDRTASYTEEAIIRSIARKRPDRRPPPSRMWIERRARTSRPVWRPSH